MRLGDNHGMAVERIPTGSLGLDIALGDGLPVIASSQRAGLQCAFIDAEHALDPRYAQQLGVDIGELFIREIRSALVLSRRTSTIRNADSWHTFRPRECRPTSRYSFYPMARIT